MKTEELRNKGLTDEQISYVMAENGKDIKALQGKVEKLESDNAALQEQVKASEEAVKKFDGVDVDKLKGEIDTYKQQIEDIKKQHAEEEAAREFDKAVGDAIGEAKGKNEKAIRALLDLDMLMKSKNQKEDIRKAIDALKEAEDSNFLFTDEKQQKAEQSAAQFMGKLGKGKTPGQMTRADYKALSLDDRIRLKNENPELYKSFQ